MTDIRDLDKNKNYIFDPETKDWVEYKDEKKEKYYTINKAAEVSGYTAKTVRRAIQNNVLTAVATSGKYLISETNLKNWIDNPEAHMRGKKKTETPRKPRGITRISLTEAQLKKMLMNAFNSGYECGLKSGENKVEESPEEA